MAYEGVDALPWADFEVAAVKLFADGALGSRTAWMDEPYPDGSHGMPLTPIAELHREGEAALQAGFTIAVHAIGTRAVREVAGVLCALAPLATRPLRLEHAQHVRAPALQALTALPIALSMQPIHLLDDAALIQGLLPGRDAEAFRFRDLASRGLPLAFGSDAPVALPDVAQGLLCATHHPLSSAQSLSWQEGVKAPTWGGAAAAGWHDCGVFQQGARADLALWENERLVGRVWQGRLEWLCGPPSAAKPIATRQE